MKYLILLFFNLTLFASNILNLNIKKSQNKIEIFFSFDTPYEGRLIQKVEKDKIKIILKDAKIITPWIKKIDSPFVYQIEVIPKEKDSQLNIYTIEKTAVVAAKSNDGFGLKIVIKRLKPIEKNIEKREDNNFLFIIGGFFIVILFFSIIFFSLKKRPKIYKKSINVNNPKEKEIKIRFEKVLDENNKLALISYKGVNYLVIIGSTNILLGKYKEEDIKSEEDFNKIVDESKDHIDNLFLNEENDLDIYKEKASKEKDL